MSATADGKKKVFLIFAIAKNDLKINNLQIVVCATQCNLMNTKMSTKKTRKKRGRYYTMLQVGGACEDRSRL